MINAIHGYTLADMYDLARAAVRSGLTQWPAGDRADQISVAWEAIAGYLCAAPAPPHRNELLTAARIAIRRDVRDDMRHRGARRDGTNTGAAFERYWQWHAAAGSSPEEPVCERLALEQIWRQLTSRQQSALLALAAFGHYQAAADALGISLSSYMSLIRRARAAVMALWHEGEPPPRSWTRRDRRTDRYPSDDPAVLTRRAAAAAAARARRTESVTRPL